MTPISDITFIVVPVASSVRMTPEMAGRKRQQNDKWVQKRAELGHQDESEERNRQPESHNEAPE
jgi:hypothetical protein